VPGGKYALYPFRIFTTWIHECCHALMALLVGGTVTRITLASDTSGLTQYEIPRSRIRHALVTSAGYPGASAAGCALFAASHSMGAEGARWALWGLGALLLLSLAAWVRGGFGMLAVAAMTAASFALAHAAPRSWAIQVLAFVAIQTSLGALLDARELFALGPKSRSDAHVMRSILWLPAAFWALLWLALSLAMTYWTLKRFAGI
jgi:hypothetical protein